MPQLLRPSPLVRRLALAAASAILAACTTPPAVPVVAMKKAAPLERPVPAAALRALAARFPQAQVVSSSSGPLRAPGADDVAVVLALGGAPAAFAVALLEPGPRDDWQVAAVSQDIVPGCVRCSVSADLARHGLYVHVIRAQGKDFENFSYQFASADGDEALRLVGVTAYVPARPDDPASHSFSASVDLLTGKRTDIVEEAQNDDTLHRERASSVPLRPLIAFDTFAFTPEALDVETRRLPPVVFDPAGTLPAVAADVLRERFPSMTVQSQASGSLRGDGGRDIVAVLAPADRAARSGAAADAVVAVLLGQPDGSLRLADVSAPLAHDCPTCDVQVQIARRLLTVQTTEVSATGSQSVAWQFASRSRDLPLRLVAVRDEASVRGDDGDGRRRVSQVNLVSGERVDVFDDVVHGRRSRSEQKARRPARPPIALAAFGFDPAVLDDDAGAELARDAKPEGGAAAAGLSGS
jgi:hypothetical protein